jgi:hypothetical protein
LQRVRRLVFGDRIELVLERADLVVQRVEDAQQ